MECDAGWEVQQKQPPVLMLVVQHRCHALIALLDTGSSVSMLLTSPYDNMGAPPLPGSAGPVLHLERMKSHRVPPEVPCLRTSPGAL